MFERVYAVLPQSSSAMEGYSGSGADIINLLLDMHILEDEEVRRLLDDRIPFE